MSPNRTGGNCGPIAVGKPRKRREREKGARLLHVETQWRELDKDKPTKKGRKEWLNVKVHVVR
jgi:hypothetical protein